MNLMHRIQKSHWFRSIRSSPRVIATRHPPAPIHVASIPEEIGGPKFDAAQLSRPEFTVIMTRSIQANSFRVTMPKRTSKTTKSSKKHYTIHTWAPQTPRPPPNPKRPPPPPTATNDANNITNPYYNRTPPKTRTGPIPGIHNSPTRRRKKGSRSNCKNDVCQNS